MLHRIGNLVIEFKKRLNDCVHVMNAYTEGHFDSNKKMEYDGKHRPESHDLRHWLRYPPLRDKEC